MDWLCLIPTHLRNAPFMSEALDMKPIPCGSSGVLLAMSWPEAFRYKYFHSSLRVISLGPTISGDFGPGLWQDV